MTANKALQRTLDPSILFAAAKSTAASSAAELRRLAAMAMREFQRLSQLEIEAVLKEFSECCSWETMRRPEIPGLYREGDADFVGRLSRNGVDYEMWIYSDELGLVVGSKSTVFESEDFEGELLRHISAFCEFLRDALRRGEDAFLA